MKARLCLIGSSWKEDLYRYITGIIQNQNHKVLAINGMPDHVHVFFGLRPTQALADLMQDIKGSSSKWINEKRLTRGRFEWQSGYGAFSYSKKQVPDVINYILNQEAHHERATFIEEYRSLLDEFEISHEDRYVFRTV